MVCCVDGIVRWSHDRSRLISFDFVWFRLVTTGRRALPLRMAAAAVVACFCKFTSLRWSALLLFVFGKKIDLYRFLFWKKRERPLVETRFGFCLMGQREKESNVAKIENTFFWNFWKTWKSGWINLGNRLQSWERQERKWAKWLLGEWSRVRERERAIEMNAKRKSKSTFHCDQNTKLSLCWNN